VALVKRAFRLSAGQPKRVHVYQHQVVVGSAGENLKPVFHAGRGKGAAVLDYLFRIVLEVRRCRLFEGHRLRSDYVRKRAAHNERAASVEGLRKLSGGKYESSSHFLFFL
jgi:hypothetical protein